MSDIARTTGRGFLVLTAAKVWFLLTGAFVNLSLPLFFDRCSTQGTAAFGDYGVVINLVSILNMVMITGTLQAVSKVISEVPSRSATLVRRAVTVQVGIGVPIAVAYFVVAPLTAAALNDPNLSPYIRLSAGIILMYSFYAVFVGYFNGRKEFVRQASLDISFATLKTILIVGAVSAGLGVIGAIGGFVATAVVMTAISIAWMIRRERSLHGPASPQPPEPTSPGRIQRILGYMVALMAYTFFLNIIIRTDLFCLKSVAAHRYADLGVEAHQVSLLSSSLSGIYTGMANIARLPYQAVIAITFVIFPIISQTTFEGNQRATRDYIRQTLRYTTLLVGSMVVVLIATRGPLVQALYPQAYGPGTTALLWLALGMVAFALGFVGTTILNSAGHPLWSLTIVAGTLAAAVALNLGMLFTGDVGEPMLARAAVATLMATSVVSIATLALIYRKYGASIPLPTTIRTLLVSLAIIASARVLGFIPEVVWLGIDASVILGLVSVPIWLKSKPSKERRTTLVTLVDLGILAGLACGFTLIDQDGRLWALLIIGGKMAFLGILFYALLYALREFGPEDVRRLRSVFRLRPSPSKEGP